MKFYKTRLLFSIISFVLFSGNIFAQFSMSEGTRNVATVMTIIEKMYVDDIDDKKLSEDAIIEILGKLDPHSSYVKAEELQEMNEPLEGNFDGIGVSFNMLTDTLYIIETVAGGPSEKLGILAGDRIVKVNDTIIAGVKMSNKDIMKRLRGPKGTTVNVSILRRGVKGFIDFKITRAKIPIYSVDASYMLDSKNGYIKISRFGATTHDEFIEALSKLRNQGMTGLIVDLQGNGGGYLGTAIDIAKEFLGKDKLIVYTEGKNQPRFSETSQSDGVFEQGKLVVLVSETSASASEIVSGAVQDWDRGVIVGRRTFGKGLVQRQIPLPNKAAMRLTVARYYTPTGRCIQKPYTNGDKDDYEKDLYKRYQHGEMLSVDSIQLPDSLKYTTLVNKRVVYGGGGIMPDEFVPIDTLTNYHVQLLAKGLLHKVYLKEADNNRSLILKMYPSIEQYKQYYEVDEKLMTELLNSAKEEKIEFKEQDYALSKPMIKAQLKALIAQNVYHTSDYYRIMNDYSPVFIRGLEIINDDTLYNSLLEH